jgi:hypothetical protein
MRSPVSRFTVRMWLPLGVAAEGLFALDLERACVRPGIIPAARQDEDLPHNVPYLLGAEAESGL